MGKWRPGETQTRPDQTRPSEHSGVCSECSEDQLCQMASPCSLFSPRPPATTGSARTYGQGTHSWVPKPSSEKPLERKSPTAKPFRPRSGEGGRLHHSGQLPRSRTDPPQIHRFKGHQQRGGHYQRQDQTSEKPGRGDPEVTSDLMTTPPTNQVYVEGLEYRTPPHPHPGPGGGGEGQQAQSSPLSFLEKGLGAPRPQHRRKRSEDRWDSPAPVQPSPRLSQVGGARGRPEGSDAPKGVGGGVSSEGRRRAG